MEKQTIDSVILELMASRICHDLISPVGAVNNGVEFLEEDMGGGVPDDAVQLISMSAQMAAARLQVFRLAYGTGGRDPSVKPEDVYKTLEAYVSGEGKVRQDWDPVATFAGVDREEGSSKILLCALLLACETLTKGGTLRVAQVDGTITVTGEGPEVLVRPGVVEALSRTLPVDQVDPRLVHPYICGIMVAQYGYDIQIAASEPGKVSLKILENSPR